MPDGSSSSTIARANADDGLDVDSWPRPALPHGVNRDSCCLVKVDSQLIIHALLIRSLDDTLWTLR